MKFRMAMLFALALDFASGGAGLLAEVPVQEQEIQSFFKEIWSPYCKGNSLLECPSSQAQELRDRIKREYFAGHSIEEIRSQLQKEYGDQLKMQPATGFRGDLAYLIPWIALAFVALGIFLYWRARIRTPQVAASTSQSLQIDPALQKEIDERLL